MNLSTHPYYKEMLHRGRLIPFFTKENRLVCFITFFIGNSNEEEKFTQADAWEILEDTPSGDVCFISQLWTDKAYDNRKLSYGIWKRFKWYIKNEYQSVKIIKWRRWDKFNQVVRTYKKEI